MCRPPACSVLGPTITVDPGDTLAITVYNHLPKATERGAFTETEGRLLNTPHSYQLTGIHTHGLHVSPSGGADNVFAPIHPGDSRTYVYDIPANHGGGTFWVHPHWHSTEALQVGGGSALPLIVRDRPGVLPNDIATAPELLLGFTTLVMPVMHRIEGQASQKLSLCDG